MAADREKVLEALRTVSYPGFSRDIVSTGLVRDVQIRDGRVVVRLDAEATPPNVLSVVETAARTAVGSLDGVSSVELLRVSASASSGLRVLGSPPAAAPSRAVEAPLLPGVRHVVAVASGKGGVGKSTVAVNLSVALARRGARVGLLDADIYGPSIPLMMGTDEKPRVDDSGRRLVPFERYGVRFMSLGFLVDKDAAVIWRGPMVMKALSQLLGEVSWGDLDVLVVDLPPGTGDAQLTLSQKVQLAGSIIVTTPQDVALADAIKGVAMFRKVGVPVLGLVENMSFFACPHCGGRTEVFGHGGGRREASRLKAPFLGEIPLDAAIRDSGDRGEPIAASDPDSPRAEGFLEIADRLLEALDAGAPAREVESDGFLARLRRGWTGSRS